MDPNRTTFKVVRAGDVPPLNMEEHDYTDAQIMDMLVAQNGNIARTASKLDVATDVVYACIAKNPKQLSTRFRAVLLVTTFNMVIKQQEVLAAALGEMSGDALGRTYAASLTAFSNLAGQFPEEAADDHNDDATAGKQFILDRLEEAGKREQLDVAIETQEASSG
jgi:hypothetical protein